MNAIILAAMIIIQPPTVRLMPLQIIHTLCGATGEYDACTRFVAYRLETSCSGRRLSATMTMRPVIFLYNIRQLSHEQEHIDDIRALAAGYVTDIEQKSFETESQCREEARIASEGFGTWLHDAAVDSVRRLH